MLEFNEFWKKMRWFQHLRSEQYYKYNTIILFLKFYLGFFGGSPMKSFYCLIIAFSFSMIGDSQVASAANGGGSCSGLPACGITTHCSTRCCGKKGESYGFFCMYGTVCNPVAHYCEKAGAK